MDIRTARQVDVEAFRTVFAGGGEVTVAPQIADDKGNSVGRDAAVYNDGQLVGLISWPDLVEVMSEAGGWNTGAGAALDEETGEIADSVELLRAGLNRKLTARKNELLAEIAGIDGRMVRGSNES